MKSISFAWTTGALARGNKTVTRRFWNDAYASRFHKDDRVLALDKSYRWGGKPVAIIEITRDPYKEKLSKMTESEMQAEGGLWDSAKDFVKMMGGPDKEPWVVRFKMIEDVRKLGGIWKHLKITANDIERNRKELLLLLEKKAERGKV